MAISRFETPAQADFINTYVPIPFESMMAAGAAKQQRYDQTMAGANMQASAIGQIQATPGSQDEITLAEINKNVEDVISKYSMGNIDLSNSVIKANFDREIKQAAPREVLNKIAGTYAGYVNDMKERTALNRTGDLAPNSMQFDFRGYDSREKGVYSGMATRRRNPDDFVRELFSEMKSEDLGITETDVKGLLKSNFGVTSTRVREHAIANLNSFVQSADGQYLINETKVLNPEEDRDDKQIALDYLLAKGPEFTQSRSQIIRDPSFVAPKAKDYVRGSDFDLFAPRGATGDVGSDTLSDKKVDNLRRDLEKTKQQAESGMTRFVKGTPNHTQALKNLNAADAAIAEFDRKQSNIHNLMTKKYGAIYDTAFESAIDDIVKIKGFNNRDEATKELMSILVKDSDLEALMFGNYAKEVGVALPNMLMFLDASAKKASAVLAADIFTAVDQFKGREGAKLAEYDYSTFRKTYAILKPKTDYIDPTADKSKVKNIVIDFVKEINNYSKDASKFKKELNNLHHASHETVDVQLSIPVGDIKGVKYVLDNEGKPVQASLISKMLVQALANPLPGTVRLVSGNPVGKDKKLEENLHKYKIVDHSIELDTDRTDNYAPVTRVVMENKKDGELITVDVVWKEEYQRDQIVSDLSAGGANSAALFVSAPYIAETIDETVFREGTEKQFTLKTEYGTIEDTIKISLEGGVYTIYSPALAKEYPEQFSKPLSLNNKEEVKNITYSFLMALNRIEERNLIEKGL